MKQDIQTVRQRKEVRRVKCALVVLGMHRSGTSLLAGILHHLGCKGPKTPLASNERNPHGYFESEPIFRLNDEILAAAGSRWNDWQPLREGWHASPRFHEFRARAATLVQAEYGDASMIYLKDPRLCRLLPLWREALEESGFAITCIHTHRHPQDVAASLRAREKIAVEPSLGMLSWLRHVLDAELASRELPRVFTSYANLLRDWQGFSRRVEQSLGLTWPATTRAAYDRVARLVDADLCHHRADIESFLRDPLVPEPFRETLRVLEGWAADGENPDDRARLDRLRHDFDRSTPLLHAPSAALEAATRELTALARREAESAILSEKLAAAEAQSGRLGDELQVTRSALDEARSAAEARQVELDRLCEKLAAAEAERDRLSAQTERLDAELQVTRSALDEARSVAEARQVELDRLSGKLAEAEVRERKLLDEVRTWTDRIIDRDKKISRLQRDANLHDRTIDDLHRTYRESTSWRVSAPVRLVGTMLRRFRS